MLQQLIVILYKTFFYYFSKYLPSFYYFKTVFEIYKTFIFYWVGDIHGPSKLYKLFIIYKYIYNTVRINTGVDQLKFYSVVLCLCGIDEKVSPLFV